LLRRSLVPPVILFRCENFPKIIHADQQKKIRGICEQICGHLREN